MKATNLKFILIVSVLAIVTACEKENLTEIASLQPGEDMLKSLETDTEITEIPDIVVDDTVLLDHALVSQYHENLLTYTYDRSGRIDYISYIRKCSITPAEDANLVPRYAYLRDQFIYGTTGQITELKRFSLTERPQTKQLELTKYFKYNSLGQLVQIITRKPDVSYKWDKFELLHYDQSGKMVLKIVKVPNQQVQYFGFTYDKSNRLTRITGYTNVLNRLRFICDLFYDNFDNIVRKEFYYPLPMATSVNDVTRKWVINYKYDTNNNPFRDLKLPVGSLFEWMDLISPGNITAIVLDNGSIWYNGVYYKYRYNPAGYPVIRFRINPVTTDEQVIKNN